MKIEDLAKIIGKSKLEVEQMLMKDDVIELNLNERSKSRRIREDDELRIFE